ncbi:hypothetical protein CLOP_g16014 [Closterium sp. NIES-67]|nr:hypothetical protein CLOP_g16014 [Closterium sp. NIES-67]
MARPFHLLLWSLPLLLLASIPAARLEDTAIRPFASDDVMCEVHKKQQLLIMDGNLFFTNKLDQCESSCIADASCLYYTFSGLSCQLFTANMTIKPSGTCFSRKCQWGKCRDPPSDDYSS